MRAKEKIWKSRVPFTLVNVFDRVSLIARCALRFRALSGSLSPQPFFIIGCGRSGNTLIRSMLSAGGDVAIPPESYVLPRAIRRYRALSFLPWDMLSSAIVSEFSAYKEFYTWNVSLDRVHAEVRDLPEHERNLARVIDLVYKAYAKRNFPDAKVWADKTPINTLHVSKIVKVFPGARFIHIVRDPRAVASSYVNAGLESDLIAAAKVWRASIEAVNHLKKSKSSIVHEIRYDDLVIDPLTTLQSACTFLDIPFRSQMLMHWEYARGLGDVDVRDHHRNVKKPLDTTRLSAWKQHIKSSDAEAIAKIAGEWLHHYRFGV